MNPGAHPFEAGLSGTTPSAGQPGAHRDAVAGRVGHHLVELCEIDAGAFGHHRRLGGRQHLRGVDEVVAELDDLTHAGTADVHDQARERVEHGPRRLERFLVAADHQGQRALLRAGRAARQRRFEVTRTGRGDALVLRAFDVGIDGGRVDDDLAGAQRRKRVVEHRDHVRRVRHAQDGDVTRFDDAARSVTLACAERDCGVDRRATPRCHGDLVTSLDEMASHREPHCAQPDETDLHLNPLSRVPEPRVRCGRYHRPLVSERVRNFSPWAYWMLHLDQLVAHDPCPADDPSAIPAWRDRCRTRLDALLGPMPDRVPLDVEVRDTVDCGSYRRETVVFDSEATMSVPAFLLVPHDRTAPGAAVLAQHGHGPGKAEVCGLGDETSRAAIAAHNGDYAHQLAERGYVVLAPDLRCFGERADWNPPDKYGCDLDLVHAVAAGANPLAQNLWDLARALDVLEQHPLVDPARHRDGRPLVRRHVDALPCRVGRTGARRGREWLLQRVARVPHRVPWNLCGSQVLPGMLGELEHVDLGALIAPRALLIETGTEDLIFPEAGARREVARLASVYETLGAPERLEHDVFEGGHRWHGERGVPVPRTVALTRGDERSELLARSERPQRRYPALQRATHREAHGSRGSRSSVAAASSGSRSCSSTS